MNLDNPEYVYLLLWGGCRLSGLLLVMLMILWAAKNGQFKNRDRVRSLPLVSPAPPGGIIRDGSAGAIRESPLPRGGQE